MRYKSGMALIELTVVVAVIVCLVVLFRPSGAHSWGNVKVDGLVSPEYSKMAKDYKLKPASTVILNGKYSGEGIVDGRKVKMTYVFNDSERVKKTMEIDYWGSNLFQGESNYKQKGSALEFSGISGDAFLFPEVGEPVIIEGKDSILLVGVGNIRLKLEAPEQN